MHAIQHVFAVKFQLTQTAAITVFKLYTKYSKTVADSFTSRGQANI